MSSKRPRLLILGASVRAMAESARRAGFDPIGIDLFGDLDLRAVADWRRIDGRDYPDGLEALAAEVPPAPWLYTGGLENHADLVERIARVRPLLGCGPSELRAVRDPVALAETLRAAGLPALEVRLDPTGLPRDGTWLRKPIASAGGRGVRPWVSGLPDPTAPVYYQRRADGACRSAQFLARGAGGPADLLGATAQFSGKPGSPFAYRGNLGPIAVLDEHRAVLRKLGTTIAEAFGLRGLFGIDYRQDRGQLLTVEVNPRPTAALEILELASGNPLLSNHVFAFGHERPSGSGAGAGPRPRLVAKAILFAPTGGSFLVDREWDGPRPDRRGLWRVPDVADVPAPGTVIGPGAPVLTVFAAADTAPECLRRFAGRLRTWRRQLFGSGILGEVKG